MSLHLPKKEPHRLHCSATGLILFWLHILVISVESGNNSHCSWGMGILKQHRLQTIFLQLGHHPTILSPGSPKQAIRLSIKTAWVVQYLELQRW